VRYRDTVSIRKRTRETERIVLNAFLSRSICSRPLSELRTQDFANYRDERLKVIKPSSLKRDLVPIHNMFKIARDEWGIPIRDNPLDKLKLTGTDQRREQRLGINFIWDRRARLSHQQSVRSPRCCRLSA